MILKLLKNKRNGQITITIPKPMVELFGITDKSIVEIEPKDKKQHEFVLKITR